MTAAISSSPFWPVVVAGIADESDPRLVHDPRAGLSARSGEITLLFLLGERGVTLGSSLTRQPGLVERIRQIPGIGVVRCSTIAGTVGPSGEHWLGFLALARLPQPCPRPLDRLTGSLRNFLEGRLSPFGVRLSQGRVDGSWCPGFSDLGWEGRKLAGLGLRLAQGWGLVRGVVAVSPPGADELECLDRCHRLFGPGLERGRLISLADLPGLAGVDRETAARVLGGLDWSAAKMSR